MDGPLGTRVDNPKEEGSVGFHGPASIEEWQELGKKHVQSGEVTEAAQCYGNALKLLNRDGELCKALLNLSASHLKMGSPALSLSAAVTSAAIDPSNAKFLYRASAALAQMQAWDELQWCSAEAVDKGVGFSAVCAQWEEAMIRADDPPEDVPRRFRQMIKAHRKDKSDNVILSWEQVLLIALVIRSDTVNNSSSEDLETTSGSLSSHESFSNSCDGATSVDIDGIKTLKESGNTHFQAGELSAAVAAYSAAVSKANHAAVILSNRAQCRLKSQRLWEALADATAALFFNPLQLKAHYRKAVALRSLSFLREARAACKAGMSIPHCPDEESLVEALRGLHYEITAAIDAAPGKSAASTSRTGSTGDPKLPKFESEREQMKRQAEEYSSVEEVAARNSMFSMFPPSMFRSHFNVDFDPVDTRIKPFHAMFSKEGRWPMQTDVGKASSALQSAYEHGRSMSMHRLTHFAEVLPDEKRLSADMICKRLGTNDPRHIEKFLNAPIGSVCYKPKSADVYQHLRLYHSFSNAPNHAEMISRGKTHVSVGFCDLGELLAATFVDGSGGQVRWVGYDSSPYAVAKALAVHQMMLSGADVDVILAVWYSAAWNAEAKAAFRSAVALVLETKPHPDVARVLLHWQTHDVSLAAARKMWLESLGNTNSFIGNFTVKADLMALSSYAITGELPLTGQGGKPAREGSVAMFCAPESCGDRSMNEHFLQTISTKTLWGERLSSSPDIVRAGVNVLRNGVKRLQGMIRTGEIVIDARLGALHPHNADVLTEIRNLEPWTMSWSNVCDYFTAEDFHNMARMCSSPEDTIHHAYTMNWPQDVAGASIIDYPSVDTRKGILQVAQNAIKLEFSLRGVSKLLLHPPVTNPLNVADYGLYARMHSRWTDAFFAKAGAVQVGQIFPPVYSMGDLSRANSTVNMTFTYDMSIQFRGAPTTGPTEDELLQQLKALRQEDLPDGFSVQQMQSAFQDMLAGKR